MGEERLGLGSTILLPGTHHSFDNFHMCVMLNDPRDFEGYQILFVPIITARHNYDDTCVLDVGDHPFIKHKSCVHYARMGQRSETHLLKVGKVNDPLDPEVLDRVINGVNDSPHTAPWARVFLKEMSR